MCGSILFIIGLLATISLQTQGLAAGWGIGLGMLGLALFVVSCVWMSSRAGAPASPPHA